MNKMLSATSILVVLLSLVSGCATVKAAPQELASTTQEIINDVKKENTAVFEEIQRNIDLVHNLKTEIESNSSNDNQNCLNKVVDDLEEVTLSYEKLARQRDDVRKTLLKKVSAIDNLLGKVQDETSRLRQLRTDYANQINTYTDPNPEVVRTRKAALEQAIKYIDMQLQLWTEFQNTEDSIRKETLVVQKRIDSFLSIIESSAILFREGLNLLKLQRDINDALSLFTQDLPAMDQLSRDMEESWSHLDTLVNTLTSMSIEINE